VGALKELLVGDRLELLGRMLLPSSLRSSQELLGSTWRTPEELLGRRRS